MPAIADLTIYDGLGTPVAHTFGSTTTDGRKASWAERSAGTPAGYITLTSELREPSQAGGAYRMNVGINMPTLATVDGVLQVVRFGTVQVTLNFSALSTEQERLDQLAYIANYLGHAQVKTSVQKLQPFY